MKNQDPHIESLLKQFMQGETTLEQEQELGKFFANSTSIPKEWEAFKVMFAYFNAGMPVEKEMPKHNISRHIWVLVSAAAVVTIMIMIAPHLLHTPNTEKATTTHLITVENNNKTTPDSIIKSKQHKESPFLAKDDLEAKKVKPHNTTKQHFAADSIEIELERGEMEQAQQELMADRFIIEQEREEALSEQYITRAQIQQAQQAMRNENPQFIQVVFK